MYCPLCGHELKLAASLRSLANREKCLRARFDCNDCGFDFVFRPEAEVIDIIAHQDAELEAAALGRELADLMPAGSLTRAIADTALRHPADCVLPAVGMRALEDTLRTAAGEEEG